MSEQNLVDECNNQLAEKGIIQNQDDNDALLIPLPEFSAAHSIASASDSPTPIPAAQLPSLALKRRSYSRSKSLYHSSESMDYFAERIQKASVSVASKIIDKLQAFRQYIPTDEIDDMDWCINVIREGKIYETNNTVELLQELDPERAEEVTPFLKDWSSITLHEHEEQDERASHEIIVNRQSARRHGVIAMCPLITGNSTGIMDVNSWDLDILHFEVLHGQVKTLQIITKNVFNHYDFLDGLGIDDQLFKNLIRKFGEGYHSANPYHNAVHAADVLQMSNLFIHHSNVQEEAKLEPVHLLSFFLSAIVHDIGHPGFTNAFMINNYDQLAIRYNDKAVLEQFHISTAFCIMEEPDCKILKDLEPAEYRTIRRSMIKNVLATDMAKHQKQLVKWQTKLVDMHEYRNFTLAALIHAADISHSTRPWTLTVEWTKRVTFEFFKQGEKELSLGQEVTFIWDRTKVNVPSWQVGFISGVVLPFYSCIANHITGLEPAIDRITANRDEWDQMAKNKVIFDV